MQRTTIIKTPYADNRTLADPSTVTRDQLLRDSRQHIQDVRKVLEALIQELQDRAMYHDSDKITGIAEFHEGFVSGPDFGTCPWWENHKRITRHHLESPDGVPDDVNLIDVLEHLVDRVVGRMARGQAVIGASLDLTAVVDNTVDLLKDSITVLEPGPRVKSEVESSPPQPVDLVHLSISDEAAVFLRDLLSLVVGVDGSRRQYSDEVRDKLSELGFGPRTDEGPDDIRPLPPDSGLVGPVISIVKKHRGTVVDDGIRQWVAWSDTAGMYQSDIPPTYQVESLAEDLDEHNSRMDGANGYSDWRPVPLLDPVTSDPAKESPEVSSDPVPAPGWSWTNPVDGKETLYKNPESNVYGWVIPTKDKWLWVVAIPGSYATSDHSSTYREARRNVEFEVWLRRHPSHLSGRVPD